MGNLRVSELTQMAVGDLTPADLFLLSDTSAQQSKKLTLGDLNGYLLAGGNLTGSFYGTASWANNAQTASFVASVQSASYALTASFALNGRGVGSTISASWASSSLSSSFSQTAFFAMSANVTTASFATSSKFASSASFVIYNGINNGTVYNAINATTATTSTTASSSYAINARSASYASTASYSVSSSMASRSLSATSSSFASVALTASLGIITNIQTSASWASMSLSASTADLAIEAQTAITASYVIPGVSLQQYGIFPAITQSNYISQLDSVNLDPFFIPSATTSVEAYGTVVAPYTSSILLDELISLYILNRSTGVTTLLDSTPVYVNIQGQYSDISASISAIIAGQLTGSISGSAVGNLLGSTSGSIIAQTTGSLNGLVTGSFNGSTSGSFNGSTTGSFSGSLDSGSYSGSMNGLYSGSMNGIYNGSMSGSYNGSLSGSYTGSINGNYTGTITSSIEATYSGNITGSVSGSVSTLLSGSIKFPFTMAGQLSLPSGSYMLYITASTSKIFIEPLRLSKFSVASNVGQFSVSTGDPLALTTNNSSDLITFTSSNAGPFTDTAAHIVQSGSTTISVIDISQLTSNIKYVWSLTSLNTIISNNNNSTTDIQGMPSSIITMSLQNGILNQLYDLSYTSASILNVSNNNISTIGELPPTMSYINVSNNPLLALPTTIPFGVTQLYASNTSITQPPTTLPNTLVTMSFANNSGLNLWLTTLPSSLTYFDVSFCPSLTSLPTIPSNVLYLNVSNGSFTNVAEDNICANLVTNGLNNGTLNLLNNAPLLPTTLTRVATLQGRGWTVTY
jgi:hypothetical protein